MITGGNFFAAVKSFDASIAISGNLVLNAKNSIVLQNSWVAKILVNKEHSQFFQGDAKLENECTLSSSFCSRYN